MKDPKLRQMSGWTANEVINAFVPDGQPVVERHHKGGRGASISIHPRLITQEEVPTSAVGMTIGQRRQSGVVAVPVPVAAVVEASRHIDAAGAKRTASNKAVLIIGQTEEKKLPASLRRAYALLTNKYEAAMEQLAEQQERLNPNIQQRDIAARPEKLRSVLPKTQLPKTQAMA